MLDDHARAAARAVEAAALALPEGRWVDQLTGQEATGRLADLLATFPVALLVREDR